MGRTKLHISQQLSEDWFASNETTQAYNQCLRGLEQTLGLHIAVGKD
jgi:hypothetical protein